MSKFHTKTIESILEPVAQQVSRLVEIQDDADNNYNLMPDLSQPVRCVKIAGDNLVKVGYETCDTSDDKILKHEMPNGLKRVEEACDSLEQAVELFKSSSTYSIAKKKLIDGERGILQGISSILLTFDESQVRKIIQFCNQLLEHLIVTEAIQSIEDLVIYVRNLTPIMTRVAKEVEQREQELTHQRHRKLLIKHLDDIKYLTPSLISSIKTYLIVKLGHLDLQEAKINKDYVIDRLLNDTKEIIRVLKLTSDENDSDKSNVIDIHSVKEKFNQFCDNLNDANDWLAGDESISDLHGEKALKNALDIAKLINSSVTNNEKSETINSIIENIQNLFENLSEDGKLNYQVAKIMQDSFDNLYQSLKNAIGDSNLITTKPVFGIYSKLEQVSRWLAYSNANDYVKGRIAAADIIEEVLNIVNKNENINEKDVIIDEIDACKILVEKLYNLQFTKSSETDLNTFKQELKHKIQHLGQEIVNFHTQKYADDFIDVSFPLRKLSEIASSSLETINRDEIFKNSIDTFKAHSVLLCTTAKETSSAIQNSFNKNAIEEIQELATNLSTVTYQVINSAKILFKQPTNEVFSENFNLIKTQWQDSIDKIRHLIDSNIDISSFIKSCEHSIVKDTLKTEIAVSKRNPLEIITNASNIARRANRVIQIAQQEIDNSEDSQYVNQLKQSSEELKATIPRMVHRTKELAQQPESKIIFENWSIANKMLLQSVIEVKETITNDSREFDDLSSSRSIASQVPNLGSLNLNKDTIESYLVPPERPPLPKTLYPARPGLPVEEIETESVFDLPQPTANEPILIAAHNLHQNVNQWLSKDNDMISIAKKITVLMAKLNELMKDRKSNKKDLITIAKDIAAESMEITRLAKELAANCTNKRMKLNLLQICERIPTIGTQLKILSTVKATLLGAHDALRNTPNLTPEQIKILKNGTREDEEATEMLICNAQNLDASIRETIEAAKSASIRVRTDSGIKLKWIRKRSSLRRRPI